jgi:hypothetical protein
VFATGLCVNPGVKSGACPIDQILTLRSKPTSTKKLKLGARSMKSLRTKAYNFGKIASDYLKSLINRLAGMLVYPQFQCDSPW